MNFKNTIVDSISIEYQDMLNGSTHNLNSAFPQLVDTSDFVVHKKKYYSRLSNEKAEFNGALNRIRRAREDRLNNEQVKRYKNAEANFKRRQIKKFATFCLPCLICILIGLDIFIPNNGRIANIIESFSLGWAIALFVIFCVFSLFIAVFANVKMLRNERFDGRTEGRSLSRYSIIAIIVAIMCGILVLANFSQVVIHLSDNRLIYSGGDLAVNEYIPKGEAVILPTEFNKKEIEHEDFVSRFELDGWEIDGIKYKPGQKYTPNGFTRIKALYNENRYCRVTVSASGYSVVTISYEGYSTTISVETAIFDKYLPYGTAITVSYSHKGSNRYAAINDEEFDSPYTFNLSKHTRVYCESSDNGCLVSGTMIMLSDGTQKCVDDLRIGDEVIVFNHETGEFESSPILVNVHAQQEAKPYDVIDLTFEDGQQLQIVDEHGLFDKDLNEYVYLNKDNVNNFIGHNFVAVDYNNGIVTYKKTKLINVAIESKTTKIYNPASVWHINLVANNLLTYSAGMTNLFPYCENMQYDLSAMEEAINKYGLYIYEDLEKFVSEEVFNLFPFKYYKVAVGEGLITYEDLVRLIIFYNNSVSL